MFEKLAKATDQRAAQRVKHIIDEWVEKPAPAGVRVQAIEDGVLLSGRALRRRMLTEPQLRNFGK